ncbi:MAG: NAD(P)H-dependent oxidoreductase subunit E [Actinobacteria bacterium]|nr:NAD(P)H-dependent oxidoreductase subunit E [Actinomycetota bacterium]
MSPLLPKGDRPWQDDPGHIHDAPEPSDEALKEAEFAPGDQEELGVQVPPLDSITALQAIDESREPHGEPAPVPDLSEVKVPRPLASEIRRAMKRYPQKRSASIPALWAVQRRYGWCSPEGIEQAAAVMGVTPAYLQSVATFYDLFHTEPTGRHEVLVCTNISCWLRGADDLLADFMDAAGTDHPGETSEDGEVMVRGFECLGACDIAPMASIDERYYGPLTEGDAEAALEQMRAGKEVLREKRLADRGAAGGSGPRVGTDPRVTRHELNKVTAKRKAKAKAKPSPDAKRKKRR